MIKTWIVLPVAVSVLPTQYATLALAQTTAQASAAQMGVSFVVFEAVVVVDPMPVVPTPVTTKITVL
jgi:hypothetical protein